MPLPWHSSISWRHQWAYVSLGFCLPCFKDGISSDAICLKAGVIFSGWEGQQLSISTLIRDRWASSYKIRNTKSVTNSPLFPLWEAAAVCGLESLLENWRSLFGDQKNGVALSGDRNWSWNSKLKCAFQLAVPKFTFESLIWYTEKKRSAFPPLYLNSSRVYLSLPSFGVLILLFWFQNHLSILGVGKELWAMELWRANTWRKMPHFTLGEHSG